MGEVARKLLTTVIGDSGTERYSGYFSEEQNAKWRNQERINLVYEMRTSDAAIKAALKALKSPILSVEWEVFSYDDSPKGEEIRLFVEQNLFHMKRTWRDFVREALGFLEFGFYSFEKIYEIRDGMVWLKDLAPRIPRSVQSWRNSAKEPGIIQNIRTDDAGVKSWQQVFIPMSKLIVFTNDMEGDDITGQSELRPAYLHWSMKNMMYRLDAISKDRYGSGIPTVGLPEGYTKEQEARAEDLAQNVRASDKSYMIKPPGFTFEIVTPNGSSGGVDMMPSISHHNRMVLLSTLSQFLDLGSGESGSFALSKTQLDFLMNNCEEKGKYFQEAVGIQGIKELVDINFGEQEWYPELRHTPIETKDLAVLATTLKTLTDSGVVEVDEDLKKWARPTFKLPELTDDETGEEDETDDGTEDQTDGEPVDTEKDPAKQDQPIDEDMSDIDTRVSLSNQPLKFFRKLTEAEGVVDFNKLNQDFNDTETVFEDAMVVLVLAGLDKYVSAAQSKLIAEDLAGVSDLSFPILEKTREIVRNAINRSYIIGKSSASNELNVKRPTTPLRDTQLMNMDTENWAQAIQYELEKYSREFIKNSYVSGAGTVAIISALQPKVKDFASKLIANTSNGIVEGYVSSGREAVFEENLADIVSFQRTEILDSRTCNLCVSLDKRVVKSDDPMRRLGQVHNCCRGQWVAIKKDAPNPPEVTGVPPSVTKSFETVDGRPHINAFTQMKKAMPANEEVQAIIRQKMDQ